MKETNECPIISDKVTETQEQSESNEEQSKNHLSIKENEGSSWNPFSYYFNTNKADVNEEKGVISSDIKHELTDDVGNLSENDEENDEPPKDSASIYSGFSAWSEISRVSSQRSSRSCQWSRASIISEKSLAILGDQQQQETTMDIHMESIFNDNQTNETELIMNQCPEGDLQLDSLRAIEIGEEASSSIEVSVPFSDIPPKDRNVIVLGKYQATISQRTQRRLKYSGRTPLTKVKSHSSLRTLSTHLLNEISPETDMGFLSDSELIGQSNVDKETKKIGEDHEWFNRMSQVIFQNPLWSTFFASLFVSFTAGYFFGFDHSSTQSPDDLKLEAMVLLVVNGD